MGYRWTCIIPTNIYGPNDNFNVTHAHVVPALVHKCYVAKRDDKPFVISGSGNPLRQFVHCDDVAKLVFRLMDLLTGDSPAEIPTSVICCGDLDSEISIRDLSEVISQAFDYPISEEDSSLSDGIYRKTATNARLRALFPDFQFIPLREGLTSTIEWFQANIDIARV